MEPRVRRRAGEVDRRLLAAGEVDRRLLAAGEGDRLRTTLAALAGFLDMTVAAIAGEPERRLDEDRLSALQVI